MFIKDGKRFNIFASATINGVTYPHFKDAALRASLGITEQAEPAPPVDFTEDKYTKIEQDDAPYVVYAERSLVNQQALRWSKIQQKRDTLNVTGGVQVAGKWFHTDPYSKTQFLGLARKADLVVAAAGDMNAPFTTVDGPLSWKTRDGSFVLMTPALALQIFDAQDARDSVIFRTAEQKKVDTSDIESGWPQTFEEYVASLT